MKNKKTITYLILVIAPLVFGCGPITEQNKSNTSASAISLHVGNEKYFMIDTKGSAITWKGWSVGGGYTGYVYISRGELKMENGQLAGGTVEVDMNTMDEKKHIEEKLINHLKSPDFFDVKKYPYATIVICRAHKSVTGNLTIKGITHPVTFPVNLEVKSGIVHANGKLVIDRTKWNIRYKSGKFYDNLANNAISDSIEFHINIVAKKQ